MAAGEGGQISILNGRPLLLQPFSRWQLATRNPDPKRGFENRPGWGNLRRVFRLSKRSLVVPRVCLGLLLVLLGASADIGWTQTGLTLRGDVAEGENGEDVRIVFRTEGFWEITQGMGTIQWDPQVMDYVSAGDFGIPELDNAAFSRIPEGMLIFDWSANSSLGNTLPDGTILFSLTFDIRGAPGDTTTVAFTNGWTPLHFESAESDDLPFTSVSGTVSVVPEPSTALLAIGGIISVAAFRRPRSRTAPK